MLELSQKRGRGGGHRHGRKHGHGHGWSNHREHGHHHGHGHDQGGTSGHSAHKMMAYRSFDTSQKAGQAHFSTNGAACPLCENHCPESEPGCGKGAAYFDSLNAA